LVFNGLPDAGYPSDYYFGSGDWPNSYSTLSFDHDVWAYGNLTDGLVNNYDNIIEIATNIGGAGDVNSTVISTWLAGGANRNYMLAGDEWIGVQSSWTNGAHAAGDFLFDVLGINYEYNDINFAVSGDQGLSSFVFPQSGSMLGGDLYDFYSQVSSDSSWADTMKYDPAYEISVSNWLDGVDFESDVEVDMMGMGVDGTMYNIGGHRTLPAGNKIAFFSFDPLSLDTHTDAGDHYFWYGFMLSAPQVKVLDWFGIINDVKPIDNQIPTSFNISQNYPNPFNPNTNINFSIPEQSKVVIKVYDILGSEVATLVNEVKNAGNYNVDFNASNLASGMYVYTINAGDFVTSKKMMLLK